MHAIWVVTLLRKNAKRIQIIEPWSKTISTGSPSSRHFCLDLRGILTDTDMRCGLVRVGPANGLWASQQDATIAHGQGVVHTHRDGSRYAGRPYAED